jgi:anti-sigma factor RsiW
VNCRDTVERLSEYFDDELDDRLHDEVEAHLDACRRCARYAASLMRTIELVRQCGREVSSDCETFV